MRQIQQIDNSTQDQENNWVGNPEEGLGRGEGRGRAIDERGLGVKMEVARERWALPNYALGAK